MEGAASRLIIRLAARGTTERRLNACAPRREPTAPSQLCGRIFPGARAGALDESRGARAHPRASLGPITKISKSLAGVTHYCPSGPVGLTRSSFRSYQNAALTDPSKRPHHQPAESAEPFIPPRSLQHSARVGASQACWTRSAPPGATRRRSCHERATRLSSFCHTLRRFPGA